MLFAYWTASISSGVAMELHNAKWRVVQEQGAGDDHFFASDAKNSLSPADIGAQVTGQSRNGFPTNGLHCAVKLATCSFVSSFRSMITPTEAHVFRSSGCTTVAKK